jgi:hypothetical protein
VRRAPTPPQQSRERPGAAVHYRRRDRFRLGPGSSAGQGQRGDFLQPRPQLGITPWSRAPGLWTPSLGSVPRTRAPARTTVGQLARASEPPERQTASALAAYVQPSLPTTHRRQAPASLRPPRWREWRDGHLLLSPDQPPTRPQSGAVLGVLQVGPTAAMAEQLDLNCRG